MAMITVRKGNERSRGFALFIAIVFMSVMLLFGLALSSISYKQQILASSTVESQYAFYAADAGLECAMYADQQQNLFAYPASDPGAAPAMICDGAAPYSTSYTWNASQWTVTNRMRFDSSTRCADVVITKPKGSGLTTVYSQGYDTTCATVAAGGNSRYVSRGINAKYSSGGVTTYATLNPSDTGSGDTLSNGNLTATKNVGGWGTGLSRSTIGKSSGKWYWEVTNTNDPGNHLLAGISYGTLAGSYLGIDANGWGLYASDGAVVHSTVHTAEYGLVLTTGTVIGFALDMGAGTLTTYVNGQAKTIASGLSGTIYPAIDMYDAGAKATINFGATPFSYSVPAGFNSGIY